MIPRYTRPEMASIWEAQTRFKIWFEIEAHAADAQAELGVIPKEAAKTIWAKAKNVSFDVARIDEIERETKHDVIAAEAGGTLERILELILTAYPWCASRRPSGASADGPTCRCQSFP